MIKISIRKIDLASQKSIDGIIGMIYYDLINDHLYAIGVLPLRA